MSRVLTVLLAPVVLAAPLFAQLKVHPIAEHPGDVSVALAIRKLKSVGTFMETTAHPDDEDNGLLAMLGYGQGMRTVLVTATRGDGGQNEIGPELFQSLAVLRTEELLAVHRFDGAEQFFTRAVDFGYSFSVAESLEKWGHDEILGDFVRHIRDVRPDVIAGFLCGGEGGGQHHQASARLTLEAFRAAADPARYPEQIASGLRPWQAKRIFCTDPSGFGRRAAALDPSQLRASTDVFEPLFGRTYGEVGIEARSMHKCQGTSQLLPLPGTSVSRVYRLQDSAIDTPVGAPPSMFDGIETSIGGLGAYAGPSPPSSLVEGLRRIAEAVSAAERAAATNGPSAAGPLAAGLTALRELRGGLAGMRLSDTARFEIDFRLAQKERQFQAALVAAWGVRLEALSDDGLVNVGQPLKVSILGRNNGSGDLSVRSAELQGFDGQASDCSATVPPGASFACESSMMVAEAPLSTTYWTPRSDAERYEFDPDVPFGVPFRPSPFRARVNLTIAGADVSLDRPIEYRYDTIVAGEKRMELKVVPPLALTLSPAIAVIPRNGAAGEDDARQNRSRRMDVTVLGHRKAGGSATVRLELPSGWTAAPAAATVKFSREDEASTVTFQVTPAATAPAGEFVVRASADGESLGYEVVEYPHIHRRHLVRAAEARLKVIDVTIAPGLTVGYIMGVGDQVPPAIEQLGARLEMIGPDELASGDLSRYDAIVTGVRAYERRADLRANNHRLLEYVSDGGTLIVQYNKFEFNQAQYGPYPAKVGSDRVTDESSPVEVLVPTHPVFSSPNRIGPDAWRGWVQERGLYFLGERDPGYVDLVRLADPFALNAGPRTGALVEARYGKGRWIYVGLGLWRQLPAGTPGAYQLLANLLSLGRSR